MMIADEKKPASERYIHGLEAVGTNERLIITGFQELMELIHDITTKFLQLDTTFKRGVGRLNELEVSIYYAPLNRGE